MLWPAEILADGIELRATVTAAPGVVVESGFDLESLVEFRWQATLHGDLLSDEEIDQLAEAKRGLVRLRGRWVTVSPELLERVKTRRRRRTAAEALGTLAAAATVWRNRVTLGERQYRLGRDDRWYPFRKDRAGRWDPDGIPVAPAVADEVGHLPDEADDD